MKGPRHAAAYAVIAVMAAVIAYPKIAPLVFRNGADQASQRSGGTARRALNVSGYLIRPVELSEYVRASGSLVPDEEVDLSFETSGRITTLNFQEGAHVSRGDLLAKMNDAHLQAQMQKLTAQKKLTESREYRYRTLLARDAVSREDYDAVATELLTLEADISLVAARIAETELRAPFDGVIGLRYLSEGAYATPSTKIAKLIKTVPLKIEFSIPERYASQVGAGYPLFFRVDGSSSDDRAEVYAVNPKVDMNTRTVAVRAVYPNTDERYIPGRFTSITLELNRISRAVSIPSEALIPEMEGEKVFVYRSGKAESRRVETGLRTESRIQITQGLSFGDTLLTSGILQLREGLPVVLDTLVTGEN